MESPVTPKPPQEIQPQKVEKIEGGEPVSIEQIPINPQITAGDEQEESKRVESDALALKKVREELGISVADKNINDTKLNTRTGVNLKEKIENNDNRRLNDSFRVLSAHLSDFQGSLKGNRFNSVSFDSDGLKRIGDMEAFDPKKASEIIQGITRNFKRDFLPESSKDRMSIEMFNFTRVIESIDELRNRFIKLRSSVRDGKHPDNESDYEELARDISNLINVMRRKTDDLGEALSALRRLRGR
jgi:hypothetical protein